MISIPYMKDPIYISGPMTGILDNNYPAFNRLAALLREVNYLVYNPAENFGGALGLDRKDYMRIDLCHLLQARTLILLPGWENSGGAKLERMIAQELELPVQLYYETEKVFKEALIC